MCNFLMKRTFIFTYIIYYADPNRIDQIYIDERQLLYCMYGESCEMCLALEYLLLGSVIPALIFFSAV